LRPFFHFALTVTHLRLNLVIDIGNTRTKIGLFHENQSVEQAIWQDWTLEQLLAYAATRNVQRIILSTVAAPKDELSMALSKHFFFLELNHLTPLPFQNNYQTPLTLGKDRLAGIAGAQWLYPATNCLVIDCGTCIKYDLITADGVYHGGNIAPGAEMRIKAMHQFTARLPQVDMHWPTSFIGNSTETALQNGALRGAAMEIEGFARLFEQKVSPLQVLLTGGDAPFFFPQLTMERLMRSSNLTMIGLNSILNYNQHN
jgi:type III pantothenate kinase